MALAPIPYSKMWLWEMGFLVGVGHFVGVRIPKELVRGGLSCDYNDRDGVNTCILQPQAGPVKRAGLIGQEKDGVDLLLWW